MKISLIAALSPDRVIGMEGDMPWHYAADMAHFMATTRGHPCIMGRRTYESLPRRPLPRRPNLVLTRDADYAVADGVLLFDGLEAALAHCRRQAVPVVYICGGQGVYEQALPMAHEMILTHVPDRVEGDTHFPEWPSSKWRIVDEIEDPPLRFVTYHRID